MKKVSRDIRLINDTTIDREYQLLHQTFLFIFFFLFFLFLVPHYFTALSSWESFLCIICVYFYCIVIWNVLFFTLVFLLILIFFVFHVFFLFVSFFLFLLYFWVQHLLRLLFMDFQSFHLSFIVKPLYKTHFFSSVRVLFFFLVFCPQHFLRLLFIFLYFHSFHFIFHCPAF